MGDGIAPFQEVEMKRNFTSMSAGRFRTAIAAAALAIAVAGIGSAPALAREDGHGDFHRGWEHRGGWHGDHDRWHHDWDDWHGRVWGGFVPGFSYEVPVYPYAAPYAYSYAPPVYSYPPGYYYGW